MVNIVDNEALQARADALMLSGSTLNGIKLVFVTLEPAGAPTHAWLDVEFFNGKKLTVIKNKIDDGIAASEIFRINGGSRIPAGPGPGLIKVVEAIKTGNRSFRLKVEPIGDYSTYMLAIEHEGFDPLFQHIGFKFRPGCFNVNCAPGDKYEAAAEEPVIDYLAKDFDSFKHVLINAMMERVPDWAPTSEADLDQVILDLIAADADELSDYQDRVMNEAYLGRARKRVSLARHARLMDYHIHQGNQASTWIALQVAGPLMLPKGFGVWTGDNWNDPDAAIFITRAAQSCHRLLNELYLYTWGGIVTALEAGSTEAELAIPEDPELESTEEERANELRELLRVPAVKYLVIEERLNPETGTVNGRDKAARQLLPLLEGDAAADSMHDPHEDRWFVKVRWREEDRLKRRYCFVSKCPGQATTQTVSAFHGNLVRATYGRPHQTVFRPPDAGLAPADDSQLLRTDEAHYEPTLWGTLCRLPAGPLSYRSTLPGGEMPVGSTLIVTVEGFEEPWEEQSDLIESKGDERHFIVETDEYGVSCVRFGNNVNGLTLPAGCAVSCDYQVGRGSAGNVGADTLTGFDATASPEGELIEAVWNPFDVTDGRDPEKPEVIIRRVPQAYRARQLRAVTLEDYVQRAEELPGVSHAYADYAWTGSWRAVRVSIDPRGTTELDETLRRRIEGHLDAVRLIGEDLEIRGAHYVPLDITLRLCAKPGYWPEDLQSLLEMEFSDGYTSDGRPGFFHPDAWTFGQALHASELIGRALAVQGVDRVLSAGMRRWNAGFGPSPMSISLSPEQLPEGVDTKIGVQPFEVIRVANDPSHLEYGRIQFELLGGRQ